MPAGVSVPSVAPEDARPNHERCEPIHGLRSSQTSRNCHVTASQQLDRLIMFDLDPTLTADRVAEAMALLIAADAASLRWGRAGSPYPLMTHGGRRGR